MPYFTEVAAPAARAQTSANLLASAIPDTSPDNHWMGGASWIGELCPSLDILGPCDEVTTPGEPSGGEIAYMTPLGYRLYAECTTLGGPSSLTVIRDRLARQAEAVASYAVARELWAGAGAERNPFTGFDGTPGMINPFLSDGNAEQLSGATSLLDALGLLEQEARDRIKGQQPFLHVPIRILTQVAAQLQRVGNEIRTFTDAIVVGDAGYTGDGPLSAGTAEIQTVTITGAPTGGSYTLTYAGQTTAAIPLAATAAQVRSALEGLSNLEAGDVAVTGAGPWAVTFVSRLGNVTQMTATGSFTGGTAPAVNVATTTPGVAPAATAGIWGFATGPVFAKLGPTAVTDDPAVTVDRRTNTQTIWADRMFMAGFDPCCQLAIQFPEP